MLEGVISSKPTRKKKQRPREREKKRRGKILLEVLDMKKALERLTLNVWSIAVLC